MSTQDPYIAFMEYLQRRGLLSGRTSVKSSLQRERAGGSREGEATSRARSLLRDGVPAAKKGKIRVFSRDGGAEVEAKRRGDGDGGRPSSGRLKMPNATAQEKLCAEVWLYSKSRVWGVVGVVVVCQGTSMVVWYRVVGEILLLVWGVGLLGRGRVVLRLRGGWV